MQRQEHMAGKTFMVYLSNRTVIKDADIWPKGDGR
jgi:hypothetical protein